MNRLVTHAVLGYFLGGDERGSELMRVLAAAIFLAKPGLARICIRRILGRAPFPSGLRLARALDEASRGRPQIRKAAKVLFLAGFDGKR